MEQSPTWEADSLSASEEIQQKLFYGTPWLLVRKRNIPTERPPLVGEVSANFCG
jgi:hypothetical protein